LRETEQRIQGIFVLFFKPYCTILEALGSILGPQQTNKKATKQNNNSNNKTPGGKSIKSFKFNQFRI
jgi:hypothetical protein